ncbi:MAG: RagB/SusD family nutrient uptake outer membrane protein [Balneolales bacterium]
MKKLRYLMIVISFSLVGCDSLLDKTDPTATTFVEFFNDEEDLRRVTYSSYLDVFAHPTDRRLVFYMHEGKSDNAYSRVDSDHHQQVANGRLNSNSALAEYYYTIRLKHIGRLNNYIASIDVPYVEDEAIRARYQSILEALRVWHYFKLTDRFGDVPFMLEPADLDDARQPPVPKEEIVQTLLAMADEIAERLPPEQTTSNAYMFHRNSWNGIVMRHALYNGLYEEVITYAQEIINSGDYELHPSYADLFQYTDHDSNNEFIKIIDRDAHSRDTQSFNHLGPHFRTGNGQSYLVPTKSLVDSYWTLQGRRIDNDDVMGNTQQDYELNPNLNRDPRYEASIMGHGDTFYDETIDIYNANNPMFHENTRASSSGYWFRKYVSEDDAFRNGGSFEYGILRYAEVLLSYAEAKIMLNEIDDVTKGYINQIRERAGLDMTEADVTLPYYDSYTQEDWIDLIRNERRIEFAGEGLRYDDIIRWGIAEDVLNQPALGHTREVDGDTETLHIEDRSFSSHNYLWPFHQSSLKVEPALEQNPGY